MRQRSNLLGVLLLGVATSGWGQMPKGIPGRDSYAIRKIDPGTPCRFASELARVKNNKGDARVAFVELSVKIEAETGLEEDAFCRLVSDQAEDSVATFDGKNGFFQVMTGSADVNRAVAVFGGPGGVVLYVKRHGPEWTTWVFQHVGGEWRDLTKRYWKSKHYPVAPQYGRTFRLMTGLEEESVRPAGWLRWNGLGFVTGSGMGWKCPESYRLFEPRERSAYCR